MSVRRLPDQEHGIDLRTIAPAARQAAIATAFAGMRIGDCVVVSTDRDPEALFPMIRADYPDQFARAYVEKGPKVWRVRIHRVAGDHCCGCSDGQ